jgi:monofunctional biosynthetic peptidoglycan transglycosylase
MLIKRTIKLILLLSVGLILGAITFQVIMYVRVSRLRDQNPTSTSMMLTREQEALAQGKQSAHVQTWAPLDRISPNLQKAVIAGEDTNFTTHNGFDYQAIQKAWEAGQKEAEKEAKKEGDNDPGWLPDTSAFKRGASTISQQLAKNLYLSSQRSFLRKGQEAVLTIFLERELSKRRILELYLNVIEWGEGIYGAEAAAQHYFHKPASALTVNEAAFLSAMIPNPRTVFNPSVNPRRVARRQRVILRGMLYVKIP